MATILYRLKPQFLEAAQIAYSYWIQNEYGYSAIARKGGICHIIAGVISDVLRDNGLSPELKGLWTDHVWVGVKIGDKYYEIDISPEVYEIELPDGSWRKIENIVFRDNDIVIEEIIGE